LEVNAPYTTGAPGLTEGDSSQRFGVLLHQGARQGDGRHGAGQGKRRNADHLARAGHFNDAFRHRDIELQWRVGVDDRKQCRFFRQILRTHAQSDTGHVDCVARTLAAQRDRLPVFVQQANLGMVQIQVAGCSGQFNRLERSAAFLVDDVEALHQLQIITDLRERSSPPPAVQVIAVGRTANGGERQMVAAQLEIPFRITCVQRNFRWRLRDIFHHQATVEAHHLRVVVYVRAGRGQQLTCAFMHDAHAKIFQQGQRSQVDLFDLIFAQYFQCGVGVERLLPGRLPDSSPAPASPFSPASPDH
jgi:hypothetical protein